MRFVISILLVTALAGAGACSDKGDSAAPASEEAVRAAVTGRAESRWAALIRGDFEAAYAIEAPGYRQSVSIETFRSRFGQGAAWKGAKVASVTLSPDGLAAKVRVAVTYEPRLPTGGDFPPLTRPLTESWLYKEGRWWHVAD